MSLSGRHIVLGVTGGIAAYKSADLARRLRKAGAAVHVVMTPAATRFVAPLTFQAVSANPVHTDLLDPSAEAAMGHISLARRADLVLIAPASADFMARLAHGLADDLLATLCLATRAPIALAPAMNQAMWENAATRANVNVLRERGIHLLGPGEGEQACGETGEGRMFEPFDLVAAAGKLLSDGFLSGLRLLVTAGPTQEAIDPVRYLSNRSSGRMGFAVASAAADEGGEVTLVSGPVTLATPAGVKRHDVDSAQEMRAAVMRYVGGADIFISTAAVADYRPAVPWKRKIKKKQVGFQLELTRNPDILSEVVKASPRPFVVGFAAETEDLAAYAKQKLHAKNLDMIAANPVAEAGVGFDSAENRLEVFWRDGHCELPRMDKRLLARQLLQLIATRYAAGKSGTN
ncbi:MAG: bifunctional phosphopantothenoylcysteine decarboxylase/phosphopantothenate--cysteine ligase CoaBC [Pseudomonadota bacterium]|nr:bifunctional phosphopantothenoylcysteine decarboxylase/phosphopantothenate--cysteine ligase CoaBC [Pseudomonadota bacterium]